MPGLSHDAVLIRQLQAMLGGKSVRVGTGSWTWPGGTIESDITTVTHGLTSTPRVFISPSTSGRGLGWESTPGEPSFTTRARADTVLGAGTTLNFYWLAIG